VPQNKDLKRLVRARMAQTGESYTQALTAILRQTGIEPPPKPWFMAGDRPRDYEAGLLPAQVSYDGSRVVQLRLRSAESEPQGSATLMQSFAATRYLDRKVRFSAMVRAHEVTDWAGLWLRTDGPRGYLTFDNMQDRPLRQSTGWVEAQIVLDVPADAVSVHFGALLVGAGALDLARPRFEDVGQADPVPLKSLPEEPRGLDFGIAS
jgi:hypothetical protein